MSPIGLVLARADAHGLREVSPGRWRMRGICHGGTNPSSVSIGEGEGGVVLLKCWFGCGAHRVAESLGLELQDLFPPQPDAGGGAGPAKRRRLMSARQAMDLSEREAAVVWTAAQNLANGYALTVDDLGRLELAFGRMQYLYREARS